MADQMKIGGSKGVRSHPALDVLNMEGAVIEQLRNTHQGKLVIVNDMDFENQRVDVVLKNKPSGASPIIRNVPIRDAGAPLAHYRRLKTIVDDGESNATIGYLFFPDDDSTMSYDRGGTQTPASNAVKQGYGPWFDPMHPQLQDQSIPDALSSVMERGDEAVRFEDGVTFILKGDGKVRVYADEYLFHGPESNPGTPTEVVVEATGPGVSTTKATRFKVV